jgi:hypothetical protein
MIMTEVIIMPRSRKKRRKVWKTQSIGNGSTGHMNKRECKMDSNAELT